MSKKEPKTVLLNKWVIEPYATKAWAVSRLRLTKATGKTEKVDHKYPGNLDAAAKYLLGLVMQSEEFTGTPASIAVFSDRIVKAFEKATEQVVEALRPYDEGERSTAVMDLEKGGDA